MKKFIYLAFLIPLSVISITCVGQGEFLLKGTSGIGFAGDYTFNKNASGIGGQIAYSFRGIVDLQLGIAQLTFPDAGLNQPDKVRLISPGIAIHLLKQEEGLPISLRVHGSYGQYKYEGYIYSYNDETKFSSINVGLGIYHWLWLGGNASIVPSIDVIYTNAKLAYTTTVQGSSFSQEDTYLTAIFSLPIVFESPKEDVIFLTPQIGYGNKMAAFGFSIGAVLAFRKKDKYWNDDDEW